MATETYADIPEGIQKELHTMAKVLEESITEGGLGDWQDTSSGFGLFEPFARPQYIPTVGAVFTIPVNFHITQPEIPEEKPKEEEPKDLWEKHAESFGRPGSSGRTAVFDGGIMNLRPLEELRAKAREDARKTSLLRKAIVETLAKYASRMEHVKESERILVVVEAPKAPVDRIAVGDEEILQRVGGFGGGSGGLGGFGGGGGVLVRGFSGFGGLRPKDRFLIAVSKSDVAAATTYDQIAEKVLEIRY